MTDSSGLKGSPIQQRKHIEAIAQAMLESNQDYRLLRQIPGIRPSWRRLAILGASVITASSLSSAASPRHLPARHLPRPHQAVEVRQRAPAPYFLDGRAGGSASATTASARRSADTSPVIRTMPIAAARALTALTAKMARVAHAVVKTGTQYRPFIEWPDARWQDPSLSVP